MLPNEIEAPKSCIVKSHCAFENKTVERMGRDRANFRYRFYLFNRRHCRPFVSQVFSSLSVYVLSLFPRRLQFVFIPLSHLLFNLYLY